MAHLNHSLKKLGKTFIVQKEVLRTEMNHDEVFSDTSKIKSQKG